MKDIVIDDSYIEEISEFMTTQGERFEEFLKNYTALMQVAVTEGIQSGRTKESLENYISVARELQGSVDIISQTGVMTTTKFLTEIDTADRYLY